MKQAIRWTPVMIGGLYLAYFVVMSDDLEAVFRCAGWFMQWGQIAVISHLADKAFR